MKSPDPMQLETKTANKLKKVKQILSERGQVFTIYGDKKIREIKEFLKLNSIEVPCN